MFSLLRAGVLAVLAAALSHAQAQDAWPSRPVRLIVSNAVGNSPDVIGRLLADGLSLRLRQAWVVDNRPGADGIIGAEAAAKSAPDGYTFFFGTQEALSITPRLRVSIPYDPERDFIGVAVVADGGSATIAVNSQLPINSLSELIALARAKPGSLSYATLGATSRTQADLFSLRAGVTMQEIPYKAGSQAVQDTIAGRVPVIFATLPTIAPQVQAGRIRVLAVMAHSRVPGFASVPTVGEIVPGSAITGWFAVMAPAGTSQDIVRRVNREVDAVVKLPEFVDRAAALGWFNSRGARSLEEVQAFVRSESEIWAKALRDLGQKPQ